MDNNLKDLLKEVPARVLEFVTSPKFAALLGAGVAFFQFAASLEQLNIASKERKQIGFTSQKESALGLLKNAFKKH
jgi:hypothetical protein